MSEDYGLSETQRRAAIETASQVAHVAAAGVFKAQAPDGELAAELGDLAPEFWFNDGKPYAVPGAAVQVDDLAASDALAEFQYGLEPNGETLYRQARYLQLHDMAGDLFASQPPRIRIAFEIFARTAVAVFHAIAAEARRLAPEVGLGGFGVGLNLSPQMLEKIGDDSDDRELQDPHRLAAIRAAAEVPPEPRAKKKRNRKPKAETPPADGAPVVTAETDPPPPDAAPGDGEGGEGDEGDGDEPELELDDATAETPAENTGA